MYKNLAATRVAACFSPPAFSQSPAPLKTGLADGFTFASTQLSGLHGQQQGAQSRLAP